MKKRGNKSPCQRPERKVADCASVLLYFESMPGIDREFDMLHPYVISILTAYYGDFPVITIPAALVNSH
jgi:hypothetical protein